MEIHNFVTMLPITRVCVYHIYCDIIEVFFFYNIIDVLVVSPALTAESCLLIYPPNLFKTRVCVCMSVCTSICVYMFMCVVYMFLGVCAHKGACVWRAEINIGLLLQFFSALLLKTRCLLESRPHWFSQLGRLQGIHLPLLWRKRQWSYTLNSDLHDRNFFNFAMSPVLQYSF